MIKYYFHQKISILLSFLIINNYLILSLNLPLLFIKINFIVFLLTIIFFYIKNIKENIYLKLFFLFLIFIALGEPTHSWDARSIWLFHAKRIFYENSIFYGANNYAPFSHNAYPTIAPALASSFAVLVGHWNEVFPKLSFTLMFLPPLIISYIFFKNNYYLAFLALLFFTIGNYLFNGWMDGLVAVYFCLSSFLMYILIVDEKGIYEKNIFLYLLTFFFFITLTLIKNEGIAMLAILFLITFLIKLYNGELNKYIYRMLLLSFAFIPIFLWKYFCYSNGIYNEFVNSSIVFNILPRIYDIKSYQLIAYFLFLNEKFLIALVFFLISFLLKKNKKLFLFSGLLAVSYGLTLFFIYLSTPYDLFWHLNSSAARVIKSLNFLLAFFGLYNLTYLSIRNKLP